jgi:hypothetical protein
MFVNTKSCRCLLLGYFHDVFVCLQKKMLRPKHARMSHAFAAPVVLCTSLCVALSVICVSLRAG